MLTCLIAYPLLVIGKYFNILPQYSNVFLLELAGVLAFSLFFSWIIIKFDPFSPAVKYLLLSTLEVVIFTMSVNKKFYITITYLLVPLLSSIYLDKKTTRIAGIVCYITMIVSLYVRSLYIVPLEGKISNMVWFVSYSAGFSLEYFLVFTTLHFLSNNNNLLITSDYKSTKLQLTTQSVITGSFIELLNKSAGIDEYHPKRCAEYTKLICKYLRQTKEYSEILDEENIHYIVMAALVHDIGLWVIPERIIHKKTPLTELEIQQFRLHTIQGEELFRQNMQNVDPQYLSTCCDVILYHHEQWNGQGYPFQITETAIPLSARILFAANELDKQTFSTFDRKPVSMAEAIEKIRRMGGHEIDPNISHVIYEYKDDFIFAYEKIKLLV